MKVSLPTNRIAPRKSLPKALVLSALLATSAISMSALANNSDKRQPIQTQTELSVQNNANTDSVIIAQQAIIRTNEQKLAEQQQEINKNRQKKEQQRMIKRQEREIRANETSQKLDNFYSDNKKSIWGTLAGLVLILIPLRIRNRVYHMEKHGNQYSRADMGDYPIASRIYHRRWDSKTDMCYGHRDTRNIFQKITDFFIDRGLHHTVEDGFSYTPFITPKPVDPIKAKLTWQLENELTSIQIDINNNKSLLKYYEERHYDVDAREVEQRIKTREARKAKIQAELKSRGVKY